MVNVLLQDGIRDFIRRHECSDVQALALKPLPDPDWPKHLILDQIKARQKAVVKVPSWLENGSDVVFPSSDVLEQASSVATARYKASLARGRCFVDLTGGMGVDSWAFSERFEGGICVERDEDAAALLAHNLPLLGGGPVEVRHEVAEVFVEDMERADLVYLDPGRRVSGRKGLFRLEDGQPNVMELLPVLREKAGAIMLKSAPMLDIDQTVEKLGCVREVHVVELRGDCKEVLYILDPTIENGGEQVLIVAVSLGDDGTVLQRFAFTRAQEAAAEVSFGAPQRYLYEPGPAFMKAGAFKLMAERYGLQKLHAHTHLYGSDDLCAEFPGKVFEVLDVVPARAKALSVSRANLAVRNFPSHVDVLRKSLKLKEGGEDMVFACTLFDEVKVLIHARPVSSF